MCVGCFAFNQNQIFHGTLPAAFPSLRTYIKIGLSQNLTSMKLFPFTNRFMTTNCHLEFQEYAELSPSGIAPLKTFYPGQFSSRSSRLPDIRAVALNLMAVAKQNFGGNINLSSNSPQRLKKVPLLFVWPVAVISASADQLPQTVHSTFFSSDIFVGHITSQDA